MLFYDLSSSNPMVAAKMNSKAGLTPFKTVNEVLAMPAKVMGKTKDVVASNDERVTDLDHVIRLSEGNKKKRSRAQGLASSSSAPNHRRRTRSCRYRCRQCSDQCHRPNLRPPRASHRPNQSCDGKNNSRTGVFDGVFMTWVMNVKISSIFPGNPGRGILNDRLTRAGDPAHVHPEITFVGLDAEPRLLLFRDKAGASVARGYRVGTVAAIGKPTWRNAS